MPAEFFEPISNKQTPPVYLFFDGKQWVGSASGKTVAVDSPINGEVGGELQIVTEQEIDMVMQAASAA